MGYAEQLAPTWPRLRTESLKRGGDAFLVRQVPPACGAA